MMLSQGFYQTDILIPVLDNMCNRTNYEEYLFLINLSFLMKTLYFLMPRPMTISLYMIQMIDILIEATMFIQTP